MAQPMSWRQLVDHFENRLFELATTFMMLGLALHIALWPEAIGASAFRHILRVLDEAWLGWGFAIAGTARLSALVANGHWRLYGPLLRAGGALSGALIWLQMSIALYQLGPSLGHPPSPGIPVYFVLSVVELISMYRALVQLNTEQFWQRWRGWHGKISRSHLRRAPH
jgi:hypothetical protein